MFKNLIGLILIFFMAYSSTNIQESNNVIRQNIENKILWSYERKLTWNDFKGLPKTDRGNIEAETQCEISILEVKLDGSLPKISIGTFFLKSKSWTATNSMSTLEHEQIHFDIYELYSRKIRNKFEELNMKNELKIEIYQKYYNELVSEAIKLNEVYDNEVYFNDDKQQEWIKRITKELDVLKEYELVED